MEKPFFFFKLICKKELHYLFIDVILKTVKKYLLKGGSKMTMQKQVEYITLNDLLTANYMGLATTDQEIQSVLNSAVRTHSNEFYVGTDVKLWLSSFEAVNMEVIQDRFGMFDDDDNFTDINYHHNFEVLSHGNSYNWGGHSNCDIDYRLLQDEHGNCYAYVRIHIGSDIRTGYTNGILLDLDTYSSDCFVNFMDNVYEPCNSGFISIDGIDYSIDGNILSCYLSIYNHTTHESFEYCDSVYEFDKEGFEQALKQVVLDAIEENKK